MCVCLVVASDPDAVPGGAAVGLPVRPAGGSAGEGRPVQNLGCRGGVYPVYIDLHRAAVGVGALARQAVVSFV
ncbi:hypothetical protein D3C78_1754140 [compost metagenome]